MKKQLAAKVDGCRTLTFTLTRDSHQPGLAHYCRSLMSIHELGILRKGHLKLQ
jgi:hypothetical protein